MPRLPRSAFSTGITDPTADPHWIAVHRESRPLAAHAGRRRGDYRAPQLHSGLQHAGVDSVGEAGSDAVRANTLTADLQFNHTRPERSAVQIRDAATRDLPAITAIYNHAVVQTTAVWSESTVDIDSRAAWLADRRHAGYPVLVAVDEHDAVLGYASFGDWRARDGYRHTVEHSVHVRTDQQGKGIGKALMEALVGHAREIGKHVMVAGIESGNTGSIRLHEKLGFAHAGTFTQVGTKFGRWLDLTFLQLTLDEREPDQGARDR